MTTDGTTLAILGLLAEGATLDDIYDDHPALTPLDVQAAASEALRALTEAPRVETREERVARVRERHPHAFEPWTERDDAHLVAEFAHGATVAALARAFGRPPGAIRQRLEKLGVAWRRAARGAPEA